MPIINAGDINLEYYIEGDGPPLLMIMGFAGQASSWGRPIVKELSKSFTTIRFSNRGTGLSDKPETPTTIPQMAEDALNLLDALGYDRVSLFGISMGGMISQELVLAHPERVSRLVLGCTTPGGAGEAATPETMAQLLPTPGLTREEIARKAWPAIVAPDFIENRQDFLDQVMKDGFENPTPIETLGKQIAAISSFDATARLSQIKTPTLVIHGEVDKLIPRSNGDRLEGCELPRRQRALARLRLQLLDLRVPDSHRRFNSWGCGRRSAHRDHDTKSGSREDSGATPATRRFTARIHSPAGTRCTGVGSGASAARRGPDMVDPERESRGTTAHLCRLCFPSTRRTGAPEREVHA